MPPASMSCARTCCGPAREFLTRLPSPRRPGVAV
jgi:hypothetical protein